MGWEKWGGGKEKLNMEQITGLGEMGNSDKEEVVREQDKGAGGDRLLFHTNAGIFSRAKVR